MAIRRAVFVVPGHAEEVKEAIKNSKARANFNFRYIRKHGA